jgi:hypothetical protein
MKKKTFNRRAPFGVAQDRPFGVAQDRPFGVAQDRPFGVAQDRRGERRENLKHDSK